PDLAGVRSYQFDALVTDPSGLTDRKYYQLVNYDASTLGSPPAVTAPGVVSAFEGDTVSVTVSATDPDGDAIADFTANLSTLPAGNVATFTATQDHRAGTLRWPTKIGESGDYAVTFQATTSLGGGVIRAAFGLHPIVQTGAATTSITIQKSPIAR